MSEWKEYKLKELGRVVTGNTPSSKFPDEFGNEMPFVTPSDYKNYNKWISFADRNLSQKGIDKLQSRVLPEKSLLVTCIGSDMGKVALNKIPVVSNQQINSIIANENVDADFLYYKLVGSYEVLRMYGEAGTAVPIVNKSDFENIKIEIPNSKAEQKSIAEVLSSLDDKIDLLHRQNKTLEQFAETLFRQWFLPVRDHTQTGVEEEWNGTLSEYVKVQGGYAFKSKDFKENGFAGVIKIRNISMGMIDIINSDFVDEEVIKNIDKRFKIKSGDFLIAMTGAEIGKIGIVEKTEKEIWVNQRVGKLEAKVPYGDLIGYLALKSREGQEHIINACAGSAQENISSTGIEEMSFVCYEKEKTDSLGKEIEPLFEKIIFNQGQINTLTKLRDTLLPKLMSGEARVTH